MLAAPGSLAAALEAGRLGATEILTLGEDVAESVAERAAALLAEPERTLPDALVGTSRAVRGLRARIAALAGLELPVLVSGPPHAGHDAVAERLHALSPRAARPLVRREAGRREGGLELRATGTLHVAGAERLAPAEQQALRDELRSPEPRAPQGRARLVVSAGEDPRAAAAAGRLDRELAERLTRFPLRLPPLRRRRADLPALLERQLQRAAARLGRPAPLLAEPAHARLARHPWPGDLRDLARVAELLVAFAPEDGPTPETVDEALAELDDPLDHIARERAEEERRLLLELYRRHGTYTGVARELGLTRNAAKHRLAKQGLIPERPKSSD